MDRASYSKMMPFTWNNMNKIIINQIFLCLIVKYSCMKKKHNKSKGNYNIYCRITRIIMMKIRQESDEMIEGIKGKDSTKIWKKSNKNIKKIK